MDQVSRRFLKYGFFALLTPLALTILSSIVLFIEQRSLTKRISDLISEKHAEVRRHRDAMMDDWAAVESAINEGIERANGFRDVRRSRLDASLNESFADKLTWHSYGNRSQSQYLNINLKSLETIFKAKTPTEFHTSILSNEIDQTLSGLSERVPGDFFEIPLDFSKTRFQQNFLKLNSTDLAAFAPWPDIVELSEFAAGLAVIAFRKGDLNQVNRTLASVVRWAAASEMPLASVLLKRTFMLMNSFHSIEPKILGSTLKDPVRVSAVVEMLPYFIEPALSSAENFELLRRAPRSLLCSIGNYLSDAYFYQFDNYPLSLYDAMAADSVMYRLFELCHMTIVRLRVEQGIPPCSGFEAGELLPKLRADLGPLSFLLSLRSGTSFPTPRANQLNEYLRMRALLVALKNPYFNMKNYGGSDSGSH